MYSPHFTVTLKAPQELKDKYPGDWTYTDWDGSTKTTSRATFYGQYSMTAIDTLYLYQAIQHNCFLFYA